MKEKLKWIPNALCVIRIVLVFLFVYLASVSIGCLFDCSGFAAVSDIILLALTILTLPVIIKSSDRLRDLSKLSGLID